MKEQLQLDQLAKQDLEENYRLMLDEKDEHVKVLKMQVGLDMFICQLYMYIHTVHVGYYYTALIQDTL